MYKTRVTFERIEVMLALKLLDMLVLLLSSPSIWLLLSSIKALNNLLLALRLSIVAACALPAISAVALCGINRGEVCGCKGCSLSFVTVVSFTIHALDCCVLISVFAVSDIVIVSSQSQLLILDCHSILLMLAFSLSLFLLVG